jgi:mono/diheme cytochrome c family protein
MAYNSGRSIIQLQDACSHRLHLRRLPMLKPLLIVAAIAFTLEAAPVIAGGPHSPGQDSAAPAQSAAALGKAKKLYALDCAVCHGDNGNGKTDLATSMGVTLADWTDPKSLAGKSDKELFDTIRNGKDKMPPEAEGRAKDADVQGLILYIRSFGKGGGSAAPGN